MNCDRCNSPIESGEECEHMGQTLCEDCYMDALSPAKACDPWAVYSAKSMSESGASLTSLQEKLLDILKETQGIEPKSLAERLGLNMKDLEREVAALRHMEKLRAAMDGDRKVLRLW